MFSDTRWRLLHFFGSVKFFAGLAIGFALLILFWLAHWPSGDPKRYSGTVTSAGPVTVSRLAGGTAEGVTIKLEDGRIVTVVHVPRVPLLRPGDSVQVIEQDSLFAPPSFGLDESP